MADKLQKRVQAAIQHWANKLDIAGYKFRVKYVNDRGLQGDYARVDTDEDTREVDITINRYRLAKDPDEIEKTIVHELMHTRLNELLEFTDTMIDTHVTNPKTRRMLKRQLGKIEHRIIVPLTDALSKEK